MCRSLRYSARNSTTPSCYYFRFENDNKSSARSKIDSVRSSLGLHKKRFLLYNSFHRFSFPVIFLACVFIDFYYYLHWENDDPYMLYNVTVCVRCPIEWQGPRRRKLFRAFFHYSLSLSLSNSLSLEQVFTEIDRESERGGGEEWKRKKSHALSQYTLYIFRLHRNRETQK